MITTSVDVLVETSIARPREEVWAFVSDLRRLPEWIEEFEEVVQESPGAMAVGSRFRYTISPAHRSATLEIVELQPGRRLAWDGPPLPWRGGAARPRGFFEVAEAGPGRTRLLVRYQPELSGTMALMRPLLSRWLRRQRTADGQRLKRLLESGGNR